MGEPAESTEMAASVIESPTLRPRLVQASKSLQDVTDDVLIHVGAHPTRTWWILIAFSLSAALLGLVASVYLMVTGIGTWGLDKTVGWAFDITNFVFWIGIGHAGTLISAILYLFRQKWRTSINRAAEAMTVFAVICAGIFPLIHMGRPWLFYWVLPYPNLRGSLWVNFRSPLLWDFFAIGTYFLISLTFWYIGMVPDLATLRDRARGRVKKLWTLLSHGWNGSHRVWSRYETLYALLAGLATPLVVSVHSIVSMDFATSIVPGWHSTIFPPYFVAGAVFSGFAMVLTLMIITRKAMALEAYITVDHLERMTKIVILTSSMVGLAYMTEFFMGWYSGNLYERFAFVNRATGPYAWAYWIMVTCNVGIPQLFWIRRIRRNIRAIFMISILVNVGMWFERFVIIVTSLHRDFLPSSWTMYKPTIVEIAILIGSFGLFFTLFLLFTRFVPVIAISEVKGAMEKLNFTKVEESDR